MASNTQKQMGFNAVGESGNYGFKVVPNDSVMWKVESYDGKYFGDVSYDAYKAIQDWQLDSYTAKNDDEKRIISEYRKYPGITLSAQDGTQFGNVSYDAYNAIKTGKFDTYKSQSEEEKKALSSFETYSLNKARDERVNSSEVTKKYNIDPDNFGKDEFGEWAKAHGFEYRMGGNDLTGAEMKWLPKSDPDAPWYTFGFAVLPSKEERADKEKLEALAENNQRKARAKTDEGVVSAALVGAIDGLTFGAAGAYVDWDAKRDFKKAGFEQNDFVSYSQAHEKTKNEHKFASTIGNIAGSTVSLGALSETVGVATSGIKWFTQAPQWAQRAINTGITFAVQSGAETAFDGGNIEDVLKSAGINFVGGAVGGIASNAVGKIGEELLWNKKWQRKIIPEMIRAGTASAAFAGGKTAATYLLYPDGYKPTTEEIARDVGTAFAFGAISQGIHIMKTSAQNKAFLDELYHKMGSDYENMVKANSKINSGDGSLSTNLTNLAKNVVNYTEAMENYLNGKGFEIKVVEYAPGTELTPYSSSGTSGEPVTKTITSGTKARFIGQEKYVNSILSELQTIKTNANAILNGSKVPIGDMPSYTNASTTQGANVPAVNMGEVNYAVTETIGQGKQSGNVDMSVPVAVAEAATKTTLNHGTGNTSVVTASSKGELEEIADSDAIEIFAPKTASKDIKKLENILIAQGADDKSRHEIVNIALDIEKTLEGSEKTVNSVFGNVSQITNDAVKQIKNDVGVSSEFWNLFAENFKMLPVGNAKTTFSFVETYTNAYVQAFRKNKPEQYESVVLGSDGEDMHKQLTKAVMENVLPNNLKNENGFKVAVNQIRNIVNSADAQIESERREIYSASEMKRETNGSNLSVSDTTEVESKDIALTRVGDFYEAFGEDALKIAEKLNLTPTYKTENGKKTAMVGFPVKVLEKYQGALGSDYNLVISDDTADTLTDNTPITAQNQAVSDGTDVIDHTKGVEGLKLVDAEKNTLIDGKTLITGIYELNSDKDFNRKSYKKEHFDIFGITSPYVKSVDGTTYGHYGAMGSKTTGYVVTYLPAGVGVAKVDTLNKAEAVLEALENNLPELPLTIKAYGNEYRCYGIDEAVKESVKNVVNTVTENADEITLPLKNKKELILYLENHKGCKIGVTYNNGTEDVRTIVSASNTAIVTERADGQQGNLRAKADELSYTEDGFVYTGSNGITVSYRFIDENIVEHTETVTNLTKPSEKIEKATDGSQVPNVDNNPQLTSATPLNSSSASSNSVSQEDDIVNHSVRINVKNDTPELTEKRELHEVSHTKIGGTKEPKTSIKENGTANDVLNSEPESGIIESKITKESAENVHDGLLERQSGDDNSVRKSELVSKAEEKRNVGTESGELGENVADKDGKHVQVAETKASSAEQFNGGNRNDGVRKSDDGNGNSGTGIGRDDNVDVDEKSVGKKDFTITKALAENIDKASPSMEDNIQAIETLHLIEKSGKVPTKAQQEQLAKFKGWGGLSGSFYGANRTKLQKLLSESELKAAQSTVNDAYFTPTNVIDGIYKALSHLGFEGGNVLEPSMGVGNFFGRMPKALRDNSSLFGVEIDTVSGRIARLLYPSANIEIAPFQDVAYKDGVFDLIIGNVPFGEVKYKYKGKRYLIHDYFFIKAMDKLSDGGVMAFLTTKGTLDKLDSTTRYELSRQGNLIAAYRLPSNVFSKSAGASVVTDLIIMQKASVSNGESFINLGSVETDGGEISVNEYFVNHPENVLGKITSRRDWRSGKEVLDVVSVGDVSERLVKEIRKLPKNLLDGVQSVGSIDVTERNTKLQTFTVNDDGIVEYADASSGEVKQIKGKSANMAKEYIDLKNAYNDLIDATLNDYEFEIVESKRKALNTVYDGFVKKYGTLDKNKKLLSADNDYYKMSGLEVYDTKTEKTVKSEMFTKDTLGKKRPKKADNVLDALSISIGETGGVNIKRIADLMGISETEAVKRLDDRIVYTPDGVYELNEVYLSGNVREKYEAVKGKQGFEKNEKMLKAVIPEDVPAKNITPQFGAPWIKPDYVAEFLKETFHLYREPNVNYDPTTGTWSVSGNTWGDNTLLTSKYGTKYMDGMKIAEKALNMRRIVVTDRETKKMLVGETRAAQQKAEDIKTAFEEWCFKDSERRKDLVETFNKKFNSNRNMDFSELAKYLTFDGLTDTFKLRDYQKRAVARAVFNGNTLLAHGVGTGKTAEMISIAMELKRMGIAKKNMMVVPNHKVADFRNDILKMYPSAKVAYLEKGANAVQRQRFYALVASNDFDVAVIPHSSFGMLDVSADTKRAFINNQIVELEEVLTKAQEERGKIDGRFIGALENQKKRLEEKLKFVTESAKDGGNVFEELGVDSLFVDEAHNFKNLPFYSKLSRVAGVSINQSNNKTRASRAENMFMITDYLNRNGGRITFGTATPITNSMSEIYNMMRFLRPDILEESGLKSFDAWASMFGSIVNQAEVDPSGRNMRMKERFSKFKNVSQMIEQFRRMADILKTGDVISELPVAERIDVYNESNSIQEEFLDIIDEMIDDIRLNGQRAEHNMLEVTKAGQMAAIDLRFVKSYFDGKYTLDDLNLPNNRTSRVAQKVYKEYVDSTKNKGTQFVFCDYGVHDNPEGKYGFYVYGDLINKLEALGIPREEIAIAQEFEDKAALSAKVNTGEIRVLIGSTAVMGEGMNAQNKAVALHHMTVPDRPSDIEQREGRIIRYGNENKNVRIYRYIQEKSYDSYQWQMQERKASFINQALSGGTVEELEEMSDFQLSAREAKAIASGNPLLLEKIEVEDKLNNLKSVKNKFNTDRLEMKDRLASLPNKIARREKAIADIAEDAKTVENNASKEFEITLGKTKYTERAKAAEALKKGVSNAPRNGTRVKIGSYRGLELCYSSSFDRGTYFTLVGKGEYSAMSGDSASGNITRIVNLAEKIGETLDVDKAVVDSYKAEIETLKKEVVAEFPRAKELEELQTKLNEIDTNLGINVSTVDMSDVIVDDENTDDGENAKYSITESEDLTDEQRSGLLHENGRREFDASAGKQAKRVSSYKRKIEGKEATERKKTAEELALKGFTEEVIDGSHKYTLVKENGYNAEMKAIVAEAKSYGKEVGFFVGNAVRKFDGQRNFKIEGIRFNDGKILIRYDGKYSPQTLLIHEFVHEEWDKPEMQKAKDVILGDLQESEKEKILSQERYKGYMILYDNDDEAVWQEFVADVFAGMNNYAEDYVDTVVDYWYNGDVINRYNPTEYVKGMDTGGNENVLNNIGFGNEYSLSKYTKRIILPKREYALVSKSVMAKNAGKTDEELKQFDYVYAADNFYLYENHSIGDFSVLKKYVVETDSEEISYLRGVIDSGTYAGGQGFDQWFGSVRGGRNGDTRYSLRIENSRTTQIDDRIFGKQQRSDAVGYSGGIIGDNGIKYSLNSYENDEKSLTPERRKEILEQWERDHAGGNKPSFKQMLGEHAAYIAHGITRVFSEIPERGEKGTFFAEFRKNMIQWQNLPTTASFVTINNLNKMTEGLTPEEYRTFSELVYFLDLQEESQIQKDRGYTEILLPNEITPYEVDEMVRILNEEATEKVKNALVTRQNIWNDLKEQYVNLNSYIGFDTDGKFERKNYYQHQVIEYMTNDKGGTGSRDMRVKVGRGWLKERQGSTKAINTDFLYVENRALLQMQYDVYTAEMLGNIKKQYDIKSQLEREAFENNKKTFDDIITKECTDENGNIMLDKMGRPDSETYRKQKWFNTRIMWGFNELFELAENNELNDYNGEYREVVEALNRHDLKVNGLYRYVGVLAKTKLPENPTDAQEQALRGARTVLKYTSKKKAWTRELLGNDYQTWETIAKSMKDTHTIHQPRRGNYFYNKEVVNEEAFAKSLEEITLAMISGEAHLENEDIARLFEQHSETVRLIGAAYEQWVLPKEIVNVMSEVANPKQKNGGLKIAREILSTWKGWATSVNPLRTVKFGIRNLVGDLDAVIAGNPKILTKSKQAVEEIYQAMRYKNYSNCFMEWVKRGGYTSMIFANEMDSEMQDKLFSQLKEKEGMNIFKSLVKAKEKYSDGVETVHNFREAILRYSAYMYFKDAINKDDGKVVDYVASNRYIVNGLHSVEDKAYQLSKDLLGAYDEVGRMGQALRRYWIPFYSFTETNLKRYYRLFENIIASDETISKKVGNLLLKALMVNMLTVLMVAWNKLVMKEEDDKLPPSTRKVPHITLGQIGDNVYAFRQLGSFSELLEWIGLEDYEWTEEDWTAPIDKAWGMITPFAKVPVELFSGLNFYPSLTQPAAIRDKWQYFFNSLGVDAIYNEVTGKPTRGVSEILKDAVIYNYDYKESAYYEILDIKREWQGSDSGSINKPTAKTNALHYMKKAIRYKDKEAALKYLDKYFKAGGTAKGIKQSIATLNPMYGFTGKDTMEKGEEFIASLSEEEKEKLKIAQEFYENHLMLPDSVSSRIGKKDITEEEARNLLTNYINVVCKE